MSISVTSGVGIVTANERQIIIAPSQTISIPKYPVMLTHGAGSGADVGVNYGNQTVMVNNLARSGVVSISADYGGPQTWGNDRAMLSMTETFNYLQTRSDVRKGKVSIHGGSMGGLNALVWASANLDKVACLSLEIPVIDLLGIWRYNISGFQSIINGAYGGLFNVGLASTKDPLTMAFNGVFKNIPILVNYGDTDAICIPEKTEEFLTYLSMGTGNKLSGGHAESTQLKVNRKQQHDYILGYS